MGEHDYVGEWIQLLTVFKQKRYRSGFTLVELMITLTILGILLAIAAPSMRTFIVTQKMKTTSFDLYSGFLLAQSEAIKRNASVSITPISTSWINGWTITTPDPADSSVTLTLLRQEAVSGVIITDSRGTTPTAISYGHNGRANAGGGFTLAVDAPTGITVSGRCLSIKASGTPVTSLKPYGGTC